MNYPSSLHCCVALFALFLCPCSLLPGNVAMMHSRVMLRIVISTLMVADIAHVYGVVLTG